MCECWEFGCGHVRETLCQAYKNRVLKDEVKESTLGGDDPFSNDAGALPKPAKEDRGGADADVTVNRLPQFTLPSPTTASSVTSDADVGPGSAGNKIGASSTPELSVHSKEKVDVCVGPCHNKKTIGHPCYDCILQKVKGNSAFQRDERAAETRLYDEVGRPGSSTAAVAGGSEGTVTDSGGNTGNNTGNSSSYTRGHPAYVNNAIDLGRGTSSGAP